MLLARDLKIDNKKRNKGMFSGGRSKEKKWVYLKEIFKISTLGFFILHCSFPTYLGKTGFY